MTDYTRLFPELFHEVFWAWGPITAQFALCDTPPAPISNINIIPYTRDGWLLLRLVNGQYTAPGGTLEAGETYVEALKRELLEEAGARLINFIPLGAWKCISHAEKPYRSHLPHPLFYRYVLVGEVEVIARPSNPADAEQIVSVDIVSAEEAARRFLSAGQRDWAQLYRLAAGVRAQHSGGR
ncbi:MAG: NUDIX domain-containing protein [Chloroflexi bacterium]|nr:NUDIX domain-containing protein [Chloroflexota bacterium]